MVYEEGQDRAGNFGYKGCFTDRQPARQNKREIDASLWREHWMLTLEFTLLGLL